MIDKKFVFALATVMLLVAAGGVGSAAATSADANSLSTVQINENWYTGPTPDCSLGAESDELVLFPMNENWCTGPNPDC